jgi:rhamnose transport system ATP-binding protein
LSSTFPGRGPCASSARTAPGKSTMIKTMTGVYQPLAGGRGRRRARHLWRHAAAQRAGIAAIYQEPMVFPDLTSPRTSSSATRTGQQIRNWAALNAEAAADRPDWRHARPSRAAAELTLAEQQTVEIARAMSLDVRVLIMDEPTASFRTMRSKRVRHRPGAARPGRGGRLHLAPAGGNLCARRPVTVMRDGSHISTRPVAEVTTHSLDDRRNGGPRHGGALCQGSPVEAPREVMLSVRGLAETVSFRTSAFDLTGARSSASPALSARGGPTWGWRCSGSCRPTRGGRDAGKPVTITGAKQAHRLGSPMFPRTGASWAWR